MTGSLLLGIDIGTQGSKGFVTDPEGHVLAQHFCEHSVLHPKPGWAEHDPEQTWWGDFVKITQALLAQPGIEPQAIAAICVSGLIPDMAPTDADGRPLRNAILWLDERSRDQVTFLEKQIGRDHFHQITGKPLTTRSKVRLFASRRGECSSAEIILRVGI